MSDAMMEKAGELIVGFKGDDYVFGMDVLDRIGGLSVQVGKRPLVVSRTHSPWMKPSLDKLITSLKSEGMEVLGPIEGAKPNAPREDVYRLQGHILHKKPDMVVSFESGSGIDACKAAATLATLGDVDAEIDPYFGVGEVTKRCQSTGRKVLPVVAVMTAASSAAHLTKYSNITDPVSGQKKLIVDEAVVPPKALFDYSLTLSQPMSLTLDGGMDGFSHCLEVYLGAKGGDMDLIESVSLLGIELVAVGARSPGQGPRKRHGAGTGRSGYGLGGIRDHGGRHQRAPSEQLLAGQLPESRQGLRPDESLLHGLFHPRGGRTGAQGRRDIQEARPYQGEPGFAFIRGTREKGRRGHAFRSTAAIGFPTTLKEIEGIDKSVIDKILEAAKNPQLESKLRNMAGAAYVQPGGSIYGSGAGSRMGRGT